MKKFYKKHIKILKRTFIFLGEFRRKYLRSFWDWNKVSYSTSWIYIFFQKPLLTLGHFLAEKAILEPLYSLQETLENLRIYPVICLSLILFLATGSQAAPSMCCPEIKFTRYIFYFYTLSQGNVLLKCFHHITRVSFPSVSDNMPLDFLWILTSTVLRPFQLALTSLSSAVGTHLPHGPKANAMVLVFYYSSPHFQISNFLFLIPIILFLLPPNLGA